MDRPGPVLAVDPGQRKCGVAVMAPDRTVLYQAVVTVPDLGAAVADLIGRHGVTQLVIGDRTGSKAVAKALRQAQVPLSPKPVDEHHSSEEGRRRYFRANPRRGWRRLIPISLLSPPGPYDDYVAVVLAERYLDGVRGGRGNVSS